METAALCKPIQRFADLLRIPGTWVLTGLGKLLAALGSFPHFPQPLRLLHTHLYWRFLECQSIEVTLTQNGHLTHHEIPSVASLRPGGHFPRIGWPVSPEYAGRESVGRVQASDRGEGSAETQIHPCFQTSLGVTVQGLGSVASSGSSDAARHGQAMAHHGIPSLLAPEVKRPASSAKGALSEETGLSRRDAPCSVFG